MTSRARLFAASIGLWGTVLWVTACMGEADPEAGMAEAGSLEGSLCACREVEGELECCFGHGECVEQAAGPRVCACDEGARGETCSTPGPGVHAVRARDCAGDDPACARSFDYVVVEAFDGCVDLGGEAFESVLVRPARDGSGAWPESAPLPAAILTHGASQAPGDYYDLLEHVAANGVVMVAFDGTVGEDVTFRANRLLSTLECLRGQWPDAASLSDRYAFVGHSRGGAAIVDAARAVEEGVAGQGVEVVALVALAPTAIGEGALGPALAPAYLAVQGARDPDTGGAALGWFDRSGEHIGGGAPEFVRSLTWISGATHQRFHQGLLFAGTGELQASLSSEGHWAVARAYVGGFLQWRLLAREAYRPYFTGEATPASVAALWSEWSETQASPPGVFAGLLDGSGARLLIHDFEGEELTPASSGAEVMVEGFDAVTLGELGELDAPWSGGQRGRGLRLDGSAGQGGRAVFVLSPGSSADLSDYAVLSVRLGRTFDGGRGCEPAGPAAGLSVVLSGGGVQAEIGLDELGEGGRIEAPDRLVPETFGNWADPSCHAQDFLRPVRIPLERFCEAGVALDAVESLELRVDGSHGGGLLVDDVAFERGEGELPGCP